MTYSHEKSEQGVRPNHISGCLSKNRQIASLKLILVATIALSAISVTGPVLSQVYAEPQHSSEEPERLNRIIATSIKNGKTEVAVILLEDLIRSAKLNDGLRTSLENSALSALETLHTSDMTANANAYKILEIIRPDSSHYQERAQFYREAEKRDQARTRKDDDQEYVTDSEGAITVDERASIQKYFMYLIYTIMVLGPIGIAYFALRGLLAFMRALNESVKSGEATKFIHDVTQSGTQLATVFSEIRRNRTQSKNASIDSFRGLATPYFQFFGRSTRKEFATTILIGNFLLGIVLAIGVAMIDADSSFLSFLGAVVMLSSIAASVWISWAASARRVRDTGVNVWWTLTLLVPPLNLAAMVFMFLVPTDEFAGRGI